MSDRDGPDQARPDLSPRPEDAELSRRLDDLDRRLGESRAAQPKVAGPDDPPRGPGMGMALRLGGDFVAGVVVGAALGWGFDQLFDTSPWGLIVLLLFGFVAGVFNVLRSAGLMQEAASRRRDGGKG